MSKFGITINEHDAVADMDFLEFIMEAQESIEDGDPEALKKTEDMIIAKRKRVIKMIDEGFKREDLSAAKEYTIQLRYFDNILKNVKDAK